jgi:subtilisin family serine protease
LNGLACRHGTFVAGVLSARRSSVAPAICPTCILFVRTIFQDSISGEAGSLPKATPAELASALVESIDAGVHIVNLSASIAGPTRTGVRELLDALDYAMRRGTLVVAAAGNEGLVGSTVITRHAWVIPVVGCRLDAAPLEMSNLGDSLGRRGLVAPGEDVVSLTPQGGTVSWSATSAATPFVTGALALLWSQFPQISAAAIRWAVNQGVRRRRNLVPPLLDAGAVHELLRQIA